MNNFLFDRRNISGEWTGRYSSIRLVSHSVFFPFLLYYLGDLYSMKKLINKRNFIFLFLVFLFLGGCSTAPPINHSPTITSTAVTSAIVSESYSYDVESTDPDGDTLTYSLTTKPSGMNINSLTGLIAWIPSTEGSYNVTVQVSDGEFFDTRSFTLTVSMTAATLSPTTGVSAFSIPDTGLRITWNPVNGATYYQVYRAISLVEVKTAISKWQTGTSYDDKSATPGFTYYYWVKAALNSSGYYASD